MWKKVVLILITFFTCFISFNFVWNNTQRVSADDLYIDENFEGGSLEVLLKTNFENNDFVTVGQALTFYNRVQGRNVRTFSEVINNASVDGIFLPSDLVYSIGDWEDMWREILLGNTVFEKVNDTTYSITLIQGYLRIYLNQQGYELIKQGLIPPHLYFYSPFSSVSDLEQINLDKNASFGFLMELMMQLEYQGEESREFVIRKNVTEKIESLTGHPEEEWQKSDINLYDYYSLSYYGEYKYLLDNGYIDGIVVDDLTSSISPNDFLILYNIVNNN